MLALRDLLGVRGRFAAGARTRIPLLLCIAIAAGSAYGFALGSFSLRPLQCCYSAIKVPLLIFAAGLLVLPNFYALLAALGLGDDFPAAIRAVLAAQSTLAVTLAALAPLVLVAYASSGNYRFAVVLNGALWLLAVVAGNVVLRRHYAPLVARDAKHRIARRSWALLYSLVTIQLASMLRPFVGDPEQGTRFFREAAWDNAYVIVVRTLLRLITP